MSERDPNLVTSGLSGTFAKDGITVNVHIVRLEHEDLWSLEVVNAKGTSTVWDERFPSDEEAYAEFEKAVSEEGIATFLELGNVIPFKR